MKFFNTQKLTVLTLLLSSFLFINCSEDHDDDHDHDHEEELITTVNYTLVNGNDTVTLTFRDIDGDGGQDGTTTVSGNLTANTTYIGTIELLNETENPAEDITEEVETEGDEHEFFFTSSVAGVAIEKTDQDVDGNPIGITTSLTTTAAGTGNLVIVLKHEPTKPNNGTSANAGGSTDVEVTFPITVE